MKSSHIVCKFHRLLCQFGFFKTFVEYFGVNSCLGFFFSRNENKLIEAWLDRIINFFLSPTRLVFHDLLSYSFHPII